MKKDHECTFTAHGLFWGVNPPIPFSVDKLHIFAKLNLNEVTASNYYISAGAGEAARGQMFIRKL